MYSVSVEKSRRGRRGTIFGALLFACPAPFCRGQGAPTCCAKIESIGFSSNLPVVIIESLSGTEILHDEYQVANLCSCTPSALAAEKGIEDYEGKAEVAGRGNSSADFEKTQFKIKMQDENGNKLKFPFMGFDSERRFVLTGPGESDRSMMFNYMVRHNDSEFSLGRRPWAVFHRLAGSPAHSRPLPPGGFPLPHFQAYNIGRASGEYAPNTQYIEVFTVEDSQPLSLDDYRGVYLAVEKLDADRVGLEEDITDENPTGGFLLKYDNDNYEWDEVTVGPYTYWGMDQPFVVKEPEAPTEVQRNYLSNYLNQFMQALMAEDWLRVPDERKYTSFIDVDAFIKYLLAVEVTKNPDGYRGSTYLHKDQDKPLAAGPMWDYNEAFGMCCGYPIEGYWEEGVSGPGIAGGSAISPEGFRFLICEDPERCIADPTDGISFWYRRMWQDPAFRAQTKETWKTLRAGPWSDVEMEKMYQSGVEQLSNGPASRNYATYSEALGDDTGPATLEMWVNATARLETWLNDRLAWMDVALADPKVDYAS